MLRNKLRGTLNHQNALVVSNSLNLYDVRDKRSLENLLFQNDDRVVCTVVPKVSFFVCGGVVVKKKGFVANGEFIGTLGRFSQRWAQFSHFHKRL